VPEDRWYVGGSLGVGTVFKEPTDAPGPLSLSWANVGSAIRRQGGDTLNLLESGAATLNRGPSLNLWALNAAVPQKAVRLASIAARFASTGDGSASGDLSFSTKPPNGDIAEALRLTPQQAVVMPNTLSVGPVTRPGAVGRVEVSGVSAEFAFMRRSLGAWPATPAAGDRFLWYNPDGSARLWTEGVGDLLTVHSAGSVGIGDCWAVVNNRMARGSLTIGSVTSNFGGGTSWNANTAGLLLETASNTEIAVHDAGTRVASMVYYEGEATNRLTIGRDMGWGPISTVAVNGNLGAGTATPQARLHVNGDAIVTGELSWGGSRLWRDQGGSIELGGTNTTPGTGTPYIDFHFAGLTQDFNARVVNDVNGQLSLVASRVRVAGVFFVQGAVNDATARTVLDSLPPYSAIMGVEPTTQGTSLCWYWKDGNNVRRKAWDGGAGF
jgi:hypothetical protein